MIWGSFGGRAFGFTPRLRGGVSLGVGMRMRPGREKRTVDVLSFPGESHAIDGVEVARVSFEAMKDWSKALEKVS